MGTACGLECPYCGSKILYIGGLSGSTKEWIACLLCGCTFITEGWVEWRWKARWS